MCADTPYSNFISLPYFFEFGGLPPQSEVLLGSAPVIACSQSGLAVRRCIVILMHAACLM
jgi:hypothetical protein